MTITREEYERVRDDYFSSVCGGWKIGDKIVVKSKGANGVFEITRVGIAKDDKWFIEGHRFTNKGSWSEGIYTIWQTDDPVIALFDGNVKCPMCKRPFKKV